jgi:hypothetical protein
MNAFLINLLGASWRTTIWGGITTLVGFITMFPDMLDIIFSPELTKKIFGIATLISAFITFAHTKDNKVTGGTISSGDPIRAIATPAGTETKVVPIDATIATK